MLGAVSHLFGSPPQHPAAEPARTEAVTPRSGVSTPPPAPAPPPLKLVSTVTLLPALGIEGGAPPPPRRRPGDGFTPTVAALVMISEDPWRRSRRLGEPLGPDPES